MDKEKRVCLNRDSLTKDLKARQASEGILENVNIADMVESAANAFELSSNFRQFSFMNRQTKSGVVFKITPDTQDKAAFEIEAFIVQNLKNANMKMPQKSAYSF